MIPLQREGEALAAPEQSAVEQFMGPFSQVGSVEVHPASSCEAVVARAAC